MRCTLGSPPRRRATSRGSALPRPCVERLREQGRLGLLTQALVHYAWAATHAGDWGAAAAAGAEARAWRATPASRSTGSPPSWSPRSPPRCAATEPDLEAMLAGPERTLRAMKGGPLLAPAHLARGAEALGDGRHEEAFRHLWPSSTRTPRRFIASCAGPRCSTWSRPAGPGETRRTGDRRDRRTRDDRRGAARRSCASG